MSCFLKRILCGMFFFLFPACEQEKNAHIYSIQQKKQNTDLKTSQGYQWKIQKQWLELPVSDQSQLGMYLIAIPEDIYQQKLEKMVKLSISLFPKKKGEIKDNIQRWLTQLGRDQDKHLFHPKLFKNHLTQAYRVNLVSQDLKKEIMVIIFQFQTETLFVKLEGSKESIEKIKNLFLTFIQTIHKSDSNHGG